MSERLHIVNVLDQELAERDRAELLEFCFEKLGVSQSPPDDSRNDLSYIASDQKYVSGASITEAVEAVTAANSGAIWFWYGALPTGLHINSNPDKRPDVPAITICIDEFFIKPYRNTDPSLIFEFVFELYDYLCPFYVYGENYLDGSSLSRDGILNGEIEDVFWVNGFGPEMVDSIGRERLRNAPAWRVDECEDGGIFLWATPKPIHPEVGERRRNIAAHFGLSEGE